MITTPSATPKATVSEAQLRQMAAEILQEIHGAEVRLFDSHARGDARPGSDVDLMIIVTDAWYAQHNWFESLGLPWRIMRGGFSMAAAEAKTLLRVALRDLESAVSDARGGRRYRTLSNSGQQK
jgi:predicted nucleotidyltransferase